MPLIARYMLEGNAQDSVGGPSGVATDITWKASHLIGGGHEALFTEPTSQIDTGVQFDGETAISLAVWFRAGSGPGTLLAQHDGTQGIRLEQIDANTLRAVVNDQIVAEGTVYPGEYHHTMLACGEGIAKLYLDGIVHGEAEATPVFPTNPLQISSALGGAVVDIRIFDELLAQEDLVALVFDIGLENLPSEDQAFPVGLVAGYNFDDSLAEARDISGKYPASTGNVSRVYRNGNPAYKFNGAAFIDAGHIPEMSGLSNFTFAFWVRSGSNDGYILGTYEENGSERSVGLVARDTGISLFYSFDGSDFNELALSGLDEAMDDTWHHVVVTRSGGLVESYLDSGLMAGQSISSDPLNENNQHFFIGAKNSTASGFVGELDEVQLYNRAMTAEGVSTIYNGVLPSIDIETAIFPHLTLRGGRYFTIPEQGWNPSPVPMPNPEAIFLSSRSQIIGMQKGTDGLAYFDQFDGSGGSSTSPSGTISDPARQGRITGTVSDEDGQPIQRRVRCHERSTGRIVRETWSDAAGYYQFDDLDPNKVFTILAMDYAGEHNAVVADWVRSEVPT